jgi:uncharacterized RDD family membrane protein YckC
VPLSDELRIETPEQVALEFATAGLGSRFLAMALDTVLQVAAGAVAVTLLLVLVPPALFLAWMRAWRPLLPAVAVLVAFCLQWGYFAGFEMVWQGQTPGKRAARIRVIKDTGRPLDVPSAILRNLLRAIDGLPAFYAVGIVCMLINRESRRLGDLVAGTVVVHERSASGPIASWITESRADTGRPIGPDAPRVSLAELAVIETFLARRLDLDPAVQARTEADIVAPVTARTGLSPASDQPGVEFLKQIAREARDPTRAR